MNNKLHYEYYKVYSRRVANLLVKYGGYEIYKTTINPANPEYPCYFFKNTPELREALEIAADIIRLQERLKKQGPGAQQIKQTPTSLL